MHKFGTEKAEEGVRHLLQFADSCGGQNRNRQIAAAQSYTVQNTDLETWQITFLEKGHTENCTDDVHSIIEREKVNSIYSPADWLVMLRQIKTDKIDVNVKNLQWREFLDLKSFARNYTNFTKDVNGKVVINWMKVKSIMVKKESPHILYYKNSYQEEFRSINMLQKGGKRMSFLEASKIPTALKPLYRNELMISAEKHSDLMKMCDMGIIPVEYHNYYEHLPHKEGATAVEDEAE